MLAIEVNGQFLELPTNLSIQLNRFSPLFQADGVIRDDRTIPFTLPNSDHNARVLGFPGVLENLDTFAVRYTAKLWQDGVARLPGQFRIEKELNRDEISAYFTHGMSEISTDFQTRSLRDIMDELVVIHNTDFDKRVKLKFRKFEHAVCLIIVNGKSYSADTVEDLAAEINDDPEQTASAGYSFQDLGSGRIVEYLTLIPGSPDEREPFSFDMQPVGAEYDGTAVQGSFWEVQEIAFDESYATTYRNFVDQFRGADPDGRMQFNTFANHSGFSADGGIKRFPIVNYYQSGVLAKNFVNQDPGGSRLSYVEPSTINNTSLAPQITLRYVLQRISGYYGIRIVFPLLDDHPDDHLLILSPNTLDVPLKYFREQVFIFYRREFNIRDFVPDMRVNEFLKGIQSLGFAIDYNPVTRTVRFFERDSVVESPDYIDMKGMHSELTDKINPVKEGVKLSHQVDAENLFKKTVYSDEDGSTPRVFRAGGIDLVSRVSIPDLSDPNTWPSDAGGANLVTVNQPPKDNFALKLAYKSHVGEFLSTYVLGRSLAWDGLFQQFWKNWIVMEDHPATAKCTLYVPAEWAWTPFWNFKLLIDRSKFLIKSFQVLLESSELLELECELVLAPYSLRTADNPGVAIPIPDPNPIPINPVPA